ncbi:DUF6255 family natural product biosynthesis protein [Streptomyces sp. NPDC049577]|uniref:DUF6255 family natural product biosynthesis protein n=1 Tax=Streptomyces sp. NPDC049577 TaxID=3155153 RepID=UPI00343D5761
MNRPSCPHGAWSLSEHGLAACTACGVRRFTDYAALAGTSFGQKLDSPESLRRPPNARFSAGLRETPPPQERS